MRATHLPFVRRLTALAALLLVCLGMGLWLEPGQVSPLSLPVSLEVAATPVRDPGIRMAPARVPEAKIVLGKEPAKVIKLQARSLQDWRQEIRAGYRTGKLPWPPRAPIELTINNTGSRPLHVRLGGESFACQLDLSGGAVRRVPARGKDIFTPSIPAKLTIPPGQQETLRWERLVEVHGSRVTYLYPLSAGEYTLSVRLRVEAWEQNEFPRTLWLNAASGVTVNVVEPK